MMRSRHITLLSMWVDSTYNLPLSTTLPTTHFPALPMSSTPPSPPLYPQDTFQPCRCLQHPPLHHFTHNTLSSPANVFNTPLSTTLPTTHFPALPMSSTPPSPPLYPQHTFQPCQCLQHPPLHHFTQNTLSSLANVFNTPLYFPKVRKVVQHRQNLELVATHTKQTT